MNRKLIRASFSGLQDQVEARGGIQKKVPPHEGTSAESFYYLKQMRARTPIVVILTSDETLHGVIEWYDQRCIKLTRAGKPNLLIMKDAVRYMYKQPTGSPSKVAPASTQEHLRLGRGPDVTTETYEAAEMGPLQTAKARTSPI